MLPYLRFPNALMYLINKSVHYARLIKNVKNEKVMLCIYNYNFPLEGKASVAGAINA